MITRSQATDPRATEFHEEHEPAGKIVTWRRNGATQTCKTRPGEFRIPVKYGHYGYGQIWHTDAHLYHTTADCPTRHVRVRTDSTEFYGIVITDHRNPDGALNGITRVQVTRRGTSKHRVGSQVDVGTVTITDL